MSDQNSSKQRVRTRFAPSPTGFLHVGGVRTALFAWLVAQQARGDFILRIEDTDKVREVEGSIKHIQDSLHWVGVDWNEGYGKQGDYGPYIQSERLDIYRQWAQRLIDAGRAYADPYTKEELDAFRAEAQAAKKPFLYRDHRPENPPAWDGSQPLRFRSDPKAYQWHDEVMGDLSTGPEVIDDIILIKSDGYPTYNFAHIVDDASMQISHVIRGQEFISSMPNYLNLYEALDIQEAPAADREAVSGDFGDEKGDGLINATYIRPIFATLPHVMAIDGKKKLGKRDGAKDILEYGTDGILPAAMMNFLATLGWNDGTEQEVYEPAELIAKFDLSRIQRSPARFDEQRLLWLNGQHIRRLSVEDLSDIITNRLGEASRSYDERYRNQVIALVQDRLKTLAMAEVQQATSYFFTEPEPNLELITGNKQLKKLSPDELRQLLTTSRDTLAALDDWQPESIQTTLNNLLETTGQKPGVLLSLIRIAATWAPFSPQLPDTLALLGRERTLDRLNTAIDIVS